MQIKFEKTGSERKALVRAIAEALDTQGKYLGMPSMAYEVGGYHIDVNGTLVGADNEELVAKLAAQGYSGEVQYDNLPYRDESPAFEELQLSAREELGLGKERREDVQGERGMQASEVPDTITIELPSEGVNLDILSALLNSKASLIESALGEDCAWDVASSPDLPIEFESGKIKFEWLKFACSPNSVQAWSTFLSAAVKFSKTAKRVNTKDKGFDEENSKFAFRVYLVKIGLSGPEHKWLRSYLLRNLKGDSAFATQESKDRWLETQKVRKAVASDDISK
jgi:hypothetical protein